MTTQQTPLLHRRPIILTAGAALGFFSRDVLFDGLFQTIAKHLEPLGSSALSVATLWLSLALITSLLLLVCLYRQWKHEEKEKTHFMNELLRIKPDYIEDLEYRAAFNAA